MDHSDHCINPVGLLGSVSCAGIREGSHSGTIDHVCGGWEPLGESGDCGVRCVECGDHVPVSVTLGEPHGPWLLAPGGPSRPSCERDAPAWLVSGCSRCPVGPRLSRRDGRFPVQDRQVLRCTFCAIGLSVPFVCSLTSRLHI